MVAVAAARHLHGDGVVPRDAHHGAAQPLLAPERRVEHRDALRVAPHERSLRRVRPRHRRRRLERQVLGGRRRRHREYHLAGDEGGATRGFDAEGRGGARGAGGGAGAADGGGGAAELRGERGRVRLLYLVEEERGDAAGAAVAHPPLLGAGLDFGEELDAAVHADVVEELSMLSCRLAAEGHLDAEGAEARRRRCEALAREPHFHRDAVERVEGVALLLGGALDEAVEGRQRVGAPLDPGDDRELRLDQREQVDAQDVGAEVERAAHRRFRHRAESAPEPYWATSGTLSSSSSDIIRVCSGPTHWPPTSTESALLVGKYAVLSLPPTRSCASRRRTLWPFSRRARAAERPPRPAPMTMASYSSSRRLFARGDHRHLASGSHPQL